MTIRIPHNYTPRDYQLPLLQAIDSGYKRLVWIVHRRGGKDKTTINVIAKKMMERVGTYYYFLPTYNQGRKIIWDGIDKDGFRFLDHIPKEIIKRKDRSEMSIETVNGSILQVIGTDNIDRIVGTNPVGCVFSEYALQDPKAWAFIRPILAENDGFAIFIYTPRGDNHGKSLYQNAQDWDTWWTELLTAKDTGVFTDEQLEQERIELIAEHGEDEGQALFDQEYMCSFDSPVIGSYYGAQLRKAEDEERVTSVPYDGAALVHTYWDLGVGDSTAIWFIQNVGKEIHLIDYYENSGEGLGHYISYINQLGYNYGTHWAPHDIKARELTTGKTRLDTARSMGINFREVPQISVQDGIDKGRSILSRCWFDRKKTKDGLNALKNYKKDWDEKRQIYRDYPYHDWSSHAADAFRYMAVAHQDEVKRPRPQPAKRRRLHV